MTLQQVINKVNDKVMDSFSRLDLWFDEREEVLNYVPSDKGWSGTRILEHVMLTSHYLLLLIDKATQKSIKRAEVSGNEMQWEQYVLTSDSFDQIAKNKSFVWIRPEHMEPEGNIPLISIREKLKMQRDQCLQNLYSVRGGEGVLCLTMMSVNNLGKLDVYQYIYFLSLHIDRHIEQLMENKEEFLKRENDDDNFIQTGGS